MGRKLVFRRDSSMTTTEQSEQKIAFLRRLWKQTKQARGMTEQRKTDALNRIVKKAKWHTARIQKALQQDPVLHFCMSCGNVSVDAECNLH